GYGTDQEYLLLQQRFGAYQPRVVFLVFSAETDRGDTRRNVRCSGSYTPYCTIEGNHLDLRGIPVPRAENVFLAEHDLLAHSYVVRLLARAWFALAAPRALTNPDPTDAIILDLQKYVKMKGAILLVGLTRSDPDL